MLFLWQLLVTSLFIFSLSAISQMVLLFQLSPELHKEFSQCWKFGWSSFSRTFTLYSSHLHIFIAAASSHKMWCVLLSVPLPQGMCLTYQTMDMNQGLLRTPVIYNGCIKPSCCRRSLPHTLYLFLVKGYILFIVYKMCICLVVSSDVGGSCWFAVNWKR